MRRSSSQRGESICHECRQILSTRVLVHTPDLPVGARWQYCPTCAEQIADQYERTHSNADK